MGIKRIVDVQFWNDDKVLEYFSPEDKLFMLYLMTNPHTTQLGIYAINKKHMSFELGYTIDVINVLLDRFENKYEMIKYSNETKEIAIKNYLRYSIIKGGAPVRDCLIKEIKNVKNKELLVYVFSNLKQYELNDTVTKLIAEYEEKNGELLYCNNKNDNKNDNKNENENENDNEVSYHDSLNDSLNNSLKLIISERNDSINRQQLEEEFNVIWSEYPNKKGKANALKAYIKARKKGVLKEDILSGLYNYLNYIRFEKIQQQYIKHGSTWFNQECWNDDYTIKREVTTKDLADSLDFSEFR